MLYADNQYVTIYNNQVGLSTFLCTTDSFESKQVFF